MFNKILIYLIEYCNIIIHTLAIAKVQILIVYQKYYDIIFFILTRITFKCKTHIAKIAYIQLYTSTNYPALHHSIYLLQDL